jgi:hypothetical protein
MDLFYEEDDCSVYWNDENNWVYTDWKNIPSGKTGKEGCEEMLKLLIKKKSTLVLNDNRNVTGPWNEGAQWVAEDLFPRMVNAGLKKFAWIQSPSALSKFAVRQSTAKNQESDIIHLFEDEEDAVKWLKE